MKRIELTFNGTTMYINQDDWNKLGLDYDPHSALDYALSVIDGNPPDKNTERAGYPRIGVMLANGHAFFLVLAQKPVDREAEVVRRLSVDLGRILKIHKPQSPNLARALGFAPAYKTK